MASIPSDTPLNGHNDVCGKVCLSIACKNLKDDLKSDVVAFVYEQTGLDWVKVGKTEVIDNNLNPEVCAQLDT